MSHDAAQRPSEGADVEVDDEISDWVAAIAKMAGSRYIFRRGRCKAKSCNVDVGQELHAQGKGADKEVASYLETERDAVR